VKWVGKDESRKPETAGRGERDEGKFECEKKKKNKGGVAALRGSKKRGKFTQKKKREEKEIDTGKIVFFEGAENLPKQGGPLLSENGPPLQRIKTVTWAKAT